jgi:hypothetical protein
VTEAEWRAATDPQKMLNFLRGRASERKLRLFAVACCRHVWPLLRDQRSRTSVEISERFADGNVGETAMVGAGKDANRVWALAVDGLNDFSDAETDAAEAAEYVAWSEEEAYSAAVNVARILISAARFLDSQAAQKSTECHLLQDIFRGEITASSTVRQNWLLSNDGAVRKLSKFAYAKRALPQGSLDSTSLALLADALEDTGCTDADLLGHLRGPGPHVRGCWALDLVTGRT